MKLCKATLSKAFLVFVTIVVIASMLTLPPRPAPQVATTGTCCALARGLTEKAMADFTLTPLGN